MSCGYLGLACTLHQEEGMVMISVIGSSKHRFGVGSKLITPSGAKLKEGLRRGKHKCNVVAEGALEISRREQTSQAFGHVLSSRLNSLYRNAYRMLGNTADAQDAVQDGLLAAYLHLDQFKGQAEMSTWVTAVVHNCARLQMRKRRRHVQVPLDEPIGEFQTRLLSEQLADHQPNPEDEYRHSELSTRLTHFCTERSPTLRRTFRLRDIEGLPIRQTARILKIPCGTVKAQSSRARKRITQLMQRALRPRSRGPAKNQPGASGKIPLS
jgi:RNA polymerase sigma-70 factor, ECF subfamily